MTIYEEQAKQQSWISSWLTNLMGGVALPIFEGDICNPIDRWLFGMAAMGYENIDASDMPQ